MSVPVRRIGVLLFLVALTVRLVWAVSQGPLDRPTVGGTDEHEYDTYAWNLASGRGYRGPSPDVSDPDHVTAYRPPGPSLVYAALYVVAGHHPALVRVANCIISAAAVFLILAIARREFGEWTGVPAAAGWAVWPVSVFLSGSLLSESLAVLAFLALLIAALDFARAPSARGALLAGLALGANLLVHPGRLFFLPFLALWLLIRCWKEPRRLLLAAVIPLTALLLIGPWTLRNYRVLGAVVPFSTMGGSVLLQGNNRMVATDPALRGYNVWDSDLPEYRDSLRLPDDELGRDRVAKRLATRWMLEHRSELPGMAVAKIVRGWTPFLQRTTAPLLRYAMLLSWGPVLLLTLLAAGPALVRGFRTGHPDWLLGAAILHIAVLNVVFFGYARYRVVVEPICLLLAADLLRRWWEAGLRRLSGGTATT